MPEDKRPSHLPSLALFGLMILCMLVVFFPPILGWKGGVWKALPYAAVVLLGALLVGNLLRLRALRRARSGGGGAGRWPGRNR